MRDISRRDLASHQRRIRGASHTSGGAIARHNTTQRCGIERGRTRERGSTPTRGISGRMATTARDIVAKSKGVGVTTQMGIRGTSSTRCSLVSKRSSRCAGKARAVPLYEIAEEITEGIVDVVTENTPTVAQDVVEAYQSSVSSSIEGSASGADAAVSALSLDNPAFIAGLAAVALGGPLLALAFKGGASADVVSAAKAIDMLSSFDKSVLFDLRPRSVVKETGNPDIRSTSGKVVKMPLDDEDEIEVEMFERVLENAGIVVLLDTYGAVSQKVGKVLAGAGYKNVAIVSGGAEGPKGWRNSGMPWREPVSFSLPGIDALQDKANELASNYKENPTAGNAALALFGTLGLGTFVFTEYESVIEILGIFVVGSFFARKMLFFEDRKKTLSQIDDFLREKKAPDDLIEEVEEFKGQIATKSEDSNTEPEVEVEPEKSAEAETVSEDKKEQSTDQQEVEQWIQKWKARTSAIQKEAVPSSST